MAEKTYVMTQAEKEQLEAELEEYKLVRRPEVVERIKIARSYGQRVRELLRFFLNLFIFRIFVIIPQYSGPETGTPFFLWMIITQEK